MQYNPLKQLDRIVKTHILTNRIIVKSLKSNRGDKIRTMNVVDLNKMLYSVFYAVHNILAEETLRASEYKCDKSAEFKPRPDVEIEEEVTAYFEINGKLQHREVMVAPFVVLQGIDEPLECLTQQIEMRARGMRYNPYSLADRLEKADILTNSSVITALQAGGEDGDFILSRSHVGFKRLLKDAFSYYYRELVASSEAGFEQACKDYVPERDGIENDPRKNFKPKTVFEIEQEIKAYFKEQGMLH